MSAQVPGRIIGIDLVRSLAIFLAMLTHAFALTELRFDGGWWQALELTIQMATPTFIILFGTMLEIVYRPRFVPGRRAGIASRLLSRAIQCALLYAVSVGVLTAVWPDYSLGYGIATMLFLGVTPFTDILKFYAVVLAVAPLLLLGRERWGLLPLLAAGAALHLAWPLLTAIPSPAELGWPKEADRLAMFLLQVGPPDLGGPSVIRGLTLVVAGMALGRVLTAGAGARDMQRRAILLGLASGSLLAALLLSMGEGRLEGLTTMAYRQVGHPLYFLVGLAGAVAATSVAVAATCTLPHRAQAGLGKAAFFGRTSLVTFSWGNMILYLGNGDYAADRKLLWVAFYMAAITAMSVAFDQAMRGDGALARFVRDMQQATLKVASAVTTRVQAAFGRAHPVT